MSKTIEISREPFESANPVPFGVFWSDPDQRYMTSMVHLKCIEYNGKWLGWKSAILAAPAVERQPVAVMYADGSILSKDECGIAFEICCKVETPLYTSPPAPIAVVLPSPQEMHVLISKAARMADLTNGANYFTAAEFAAIACLDKVKEMNQ